MAHVMFDTPCLLNSAISRSCTIEITKGACHCATATFAKAQTIFATSWALNSPFRITIYSGNPLAAKSHLKPSFANAHCVFASSCGLNSVTRFAADSVIPSITASFLCLIAAQAHAVFAKFWMPTSGRRRTDAESKLLHRGSVINTSSIAFCSDEAFILKNPFAIRWMAVDTLTPLNLLPCSSHCFKSQSIVDRPSAGEFVKALLIATKSQW
eukprot:gnl/MRDRNA2_/MRDRNA2_20699_c0_seq1.p1 gnl/MRDRNA2_/MRDRNA2_20699_c0~~gnl/MRDRNA2_/MRDRNA2_20699_c0_seq1.p1  ORF type:complete len:212 (-),score=15.82 gnl/MRDRNA2_/MRDRNA2_20699_c0_seq1:35-670(-)